MNIFIDFEKLKKELEREEEMLQSLRQEYEVVNAEAKIYREHGELYDKFKLAVLEPELRRIAASRINLPVSDHEGGYMHAGAYDEVKRLMTRGEDISVAEVALLGRISESLKVVESLREKKNAEIFRKAKRAAN